MTTKKTVSKYAYRRRIRTLNAELLAAREELRLIRNYRQLCLAVYAAVTDPGYTLSNKWFLNRVNELGLLK